MPPLLKRTHTPRVLDGFGGFAALFSLDYNSRLFARNYRHPVLVTCTDGVGSKLKVAGLLNKHDTVGIDLVAMSVNDCLCTGGEPLVFLDYLAMPKDDPALTRDLIKGISDGCMEADCALVGGETAILPDFYQPGDYDMAGFCVGVVERDHIINGRAIRPGDVVLGLASTGLHSNGYSLVRKVVFEHAGLSVGKFVPELARTVGEELLEPTRIYVRPVKNILRHYPVKRHVVRGLAHITGEGLPGNVPRVLPPGRRVVLRRGSWPVPPVFGWLQRLGNIEPVEMERVFNLGIGFVMIVSRYYAESIRRQLEEDRVPTFEIGEVVEGEPGVEFVS
jgi:phosphoribosylformylglycinamidine cyclo-ligase